jgi:hypothetical protein
MFLGCCAGAVSYSAWAQWLVGLYSSQKDETVQSMLSFAVVSIVRSIVAPIVYHMHIGMA